jgi:DNA-directed RNA polymerase subunit RPC12/RpoP
MLRTEPFKVKKAVQVSYACSKCDASVTVELSESSHEIGCPHCGQSLAIPPGAVRNGDIHRCVACPSEELYIRKDFPQQLGITIVVIAIVLSSIAWYYHQVALTYAILFVSALLDFGLWMAMGNLLQCYRCQAQYRGLTSLENHEAFNLEVHEKHRQQMLRLREAERESKQVSAP